MNITVRCRKYLTSALKQQSCPVSCLYHIRYIFIVLASTATWSAGLDLPLPRPSHMLFLIYRLLIQFNIGRISRSHFSRRERAFCSALLHHSTSIAFVHHHTTRMFFYKITHSLIYNCMSTSNSIEGYLFGSSIFVIRFVRSPPLFNTIGAC